MKGRDLIALAADRAFPARERGLLAHGALSLAEAGRHDFAAALADPGLSKAHEAFAKALKAEGYRTMEESTPHADCRALFHLVAALAPRTVLEIGTHVGASTLHIAAALRHAGGGRLVSVDIVDVNASDGPWAGAGAPASPRAMLERLGLDPFVTFVRSRSDRFLAGTNERFDLIWVDGNHAEIPAFFDIRSALGRLSAGGLVLLHDFYEDGAGNPGVRRATERLRRAAPWLTIERLGPFPWNPSFATSLVACTRAVRPQSRLAIEETGS